jgi:hypothetical protein
MDIPLRSKRLPHEIWQLPEDVSISHHEVSFRGLCPKCAKKSQDKNQGRVRKAGDAKSENRK